MWTGLLVAVHIVGSGSIVHFLYYGGPTIARDGFLPLIPMIIGELCWLPLLSSCRAYYILSRLIMQPKIFSDTLEIQRGKKKFCFLEK